MVHQWIVCLSAGKSLVLISVKPGTPHHNALASWCEKRNVATFWLGKYCTIHYFQAPFMYNLLPYLLLFSIVVKQHTKKLLAYILTLLAS